MYDSFARNDARADSDIDVMLISQNFENYNISEKSRARLLTGKVDLRIEPFTVGAKRFFSDDDSALIEQVKMRELKFHFEKKHCRNNFVNLQNSFGQFPK